MDNNTTSAIEYLRKPTQCHLWSKTELVKEDLYYCGFEEIHTFYEDSHYSRRLKKCNHCGQLYLTEFYEEIDWVNGEDPQYTTYIPVENLEQAKSVNRAGRSGLLKYSPSLRSDWPSDKPQRVYWVGK
jgi:hypothetical protein